MRIKRGWLAVAAVVAVGAFVSELDEAGTSTNATGDVASTTVATPSPTASEGPRSAPRATRTATPAQVPTRDSSVGTDTAPRSSAGRTTPEYWTVTRVIDGDTIDVVRDGVTERVRLVGIDTPERGECGYDDATANLRRLIDSEQVALVRPGSGTDNRDRYDRLLRYVDVGGVDAGYEQIATGMAIARYDSRDGYGFHPREPRYIAADESTDAAYTCARPEPAPKPEPAPEPQPAAEPWNMPGPDLDCADIGMKVRITGPDYHRLDADGDGWGCESYG